MWGGSVCIFFSFLFFLKLNERGKKKKKKGTKKNMIPKCRFSTKISQQMRIYEKAKYRILYHGQLPRLSGLMYGDLKALRDLTHLKLQAVNNASQKGNHVQDPFSHIKYWNAEILKQETVRLEQILKELGFFMS